MARGPIAVYGATGYTGRLVVVELRRRGLDCVLVGRSAERLGRLAGELGLDAPVRAARLDDRSALRHAFGECAAVINCAGPFSRLGEPVVRAAVETGTHYVDTTGEQGFMKHVFDRFEAPARAAEVAVVPAMGFDYAPGDMLCALVGSGHEPVRKLVVAYAVTGFGATRGTLRSALEVMRSGGIVYTDGEWRPAGAGPLRAAFTFPAPIGRQPVAFYPSGEILTAPRHLQVRTVTSVITAAAFAPHPALAPFVPLTMPALALALRTPLRSALDAAIGRLPEGPAEEDRRDASFTVVASAIGEDGSAGRGVVRGVDPYGLTAATVVEGAAVLASEGSERVGVLAPASAFDPHAFLDRLGAHGLTYELDPPLPASAAV